MLKDTKIGIFLHIPMGLRETAGTGSSSA